MSKKTQRFDIVLLDADETIFDFQKAEAHSFKLMLEKFGVVYTDKRLKKYSEINALLWKALEKAEITQDELKILRFKRFFDSIGIVDVDCNKANDCYLTNLSNSSFLINGAHDFVKELHNYCKLYIATNGLTKAQTGRLSKSTVREYIDCMFISEQIGFSKPDKMYFDYIFKTLNVKDKSRVIILGDSLTSDMLGGKNAGITTCKYNRDGIINKSELCDYQITDYSQFFDILFI